MRFTIDHCFMFSTSSGAGSGEFAWIGILKIISSANLISRFLLGYTAVISFTMMENNTGPKTVPWGTPRLMLTISV